MLGLKNVNPCLIDYSLLKNSQLIRLVQDNGKSWVGLATMTDHTKPDSNKPH